MSPSYPWMDEGLTTYIEGYATADFWDDPDYWRTDQNAYVRVAGFEGETPIMRHADLHGPFGTYGQAAYWKPATLLRALEGVIGREAVWETLRTYAETWIYGHPAPRTSSTLRKLWREEIWIGSGCPSGTRRRPWIRQSRTCE